METAILEPADLDVPTGEPRDTLNKSSGKQALRFGMGCEAQTAAVADATARICNDADHPSPQMPATRALVQSVPSAEYDAWLRARVQESLDNPGPGIPSDVVMARIRGIIASAGQGA